LPPTSARGLGHQASGSPGVFIETRPIVPPQNRTIRAWFCIAAALVGASTADPLVEFASNSGRFGPGSFTDHSNQDVLPALAAGLALGAVYVFLRARRTLAAHDGALVRTIGVRSLLPCVFAIQIALLYGMETVEQFVVAGHSLGGTIWLGGPPLASLGVHAAICVLTTLLMARLTRFLSRKAVTLAARIVAAIGLAPRSPAMLFLRVSQRADERRLAPLRRRIGERAPPQLAA
jgi:hypothetical protein